jgi:hypothetical protein
MRMYPHSDVARHDRDLADDWPALPGGGSRVGIPRAGVRMRAGARIYGPPEGDMRVISKEEGDAVTDRTVHMTIPVAEYAAMRVFTREDAKRIYKDMTVLELRVMGAGSELYYEGVTPMLIVLKVNMAMTLASMDAIRDRVLSQLKGVDATVVLLDSDTDLVTITD